MKKVLFVHHRAREVTPPGGKPFEAKPGETYTVTDQIAASLLEQEAIWQLAPQPKKTSKQED